MASASSALITIFFQHRVVYKFYIKSSIAVEVKPEHLRGIAHIRIDERNTVCRKRKAVKAIGIAAAAAHGIFVKHIGANQTFPTGGIFDIAADGVVLGQ